MTMAACRGHQCEAKPVGASIFGSSSLSSFVSARFQELFAGSSSVVGRLVEGAAKQLLEPIQNPYQRGPECSSQHDPSSNAVQCSAQQYCPLMSYIFHCQGLVDMNKPPEMISGNMTAAMCVYSGLQKQVVPDGSATELLASGMPCIQ